MRKILFIGWIGVAAMACNDDTSATDCGAPDTHSHLVNGTCQCDPGHAWVSPGTVGDYRCQPWVTPQCQPDCSGRECGWDPICATSCGTCSQGACDEYGQCIDEECVQACGSRACGPDPACGRSCGTCSRGTCTPDGDCSTLGTLCNPLMPSPCMAGEKCAEMSDVARCVSVAGDALEGEPCQLTADSDTCAPGLLCANLIEGDALRCYRYCDTNTAGSCGAEAGCMYGAGDSGLCTLPCDPFNDPCKAGLYCATYLETTTLFYTCTPEPDTALAALGEPCEVLADCGAALVCLSYDYGGATCRRLCNDAHPCSGPCEPMYADNTPLENIGFCDECIPDCSGRGCGADPVCGASCGSCVGGGMCTDGQCCTPDCSGRDCGPDPICGANCGGCPDGADCTTGGECCTPDCSGQQCGLDPVCGTSCGSCGGNDTCDNGQCTCAPDCSGRECGSDPVCGTSCGSCTGGDVCLGGSCCAPSCSGRECGTDPACGTTCGFCGNTEYCQSGQCVSCQALYGSCSSTDQCCQQSGVDIECDSGWCAQCAGYGYDCSSVGCCGGLFCTPADICNTRDCSELGMKCILDSDCCDDAICDSDADWRCQACRGLYTACSWDDQCCSGLSCNDGMCQP